ncbi:MAG: flagellar basal body-associated FliL family protein [Nitrospinota bacterium]
MGRAPEPDQEEEKGEQEGAEAEAKGGLLKWIIIGAVLLVVLGGGGFAGWWFFLRGGAPPAAKAGEQKPGEPGAGGVMMAGPIIPLTPFIVNLADPGGRRYLKVTVEIELEKKESEAEMKARVPEIRDQIIVALSSKTFQQVQGAAGKQVLREELTARLNATLKSGKVKNLYFTDFVVQ